MKTRFAIIAALGVTLQLGSAHSGAAPSAFECQFTDGGTWSFEQGAFGPVTSKNLSFTIDQVAAQTARLRGAKGAKTLKVVRAIDARHFIEVTVAGFLNITTIYETSDGDEATMPAVHSRHLGIVGQPFVSQYRGLCRRAES